ncbi:carnitine O-palmitoyltransferase 1 [Angomonas deanei]|uniref:Choline/Carnitine o-acyltransferase, putative n=1 Tax=Angomonas deanei TaxID=59799 RepID=A0A7G2CCT1_9TRYP|nr:carnitine O-palmitoyltransferase 1 [Angomonas deanei]CAD2217630.1 Choline/Carnitine o-acyltransferase, putative [Angomonas deanei]|eukprot:EPY27229.1 carnitine O-palmitoyltransferase 1 [Angomonas deanei]
MSEAYQGLRPTATLLSGGFVVDRNSSNFTASLTSKGLDIHIPHPRFIWRGVRRAFWHGIAKVRSTVYPVPLVVVLGSAVGWCAFSGYAPPTSLIHTHPLVAKLCYLDKVFNPLFRLTPPQWREPLMWGKIWTAVLVASTVLHRFITRRLLRYKGWITEKNREKPGWRTRLWATVTKLFVHTKANTLDNYERCLPSVSLPSLQHTVSKFLYCMKPIFDQYPDPEDWSELTRAAADFLENEGPVLQRHLRLYRVVNDSFISDWSTRNVFLAARQSLCLHSNYYILPYADYRPTTHRNARVAVLVHELVKLNTKIKQRSLNPPVTGPGGCVPMAVNQYFLAFNTTRIPGREIDLIEHEDSNENSYIIVLIAGRIYQISVLHPHTHRPLTPLQLEYVLGELHKDVEDELSSGRESSEEESEEELPEEKQAKRKSYRIAESLLPTLTTAPRAEWADVRTNFLLNDPKNKTPLRVIEKAMFVVSMEEESTRTKRVENGLAGDCAEFLCGNGSNLWCDKSFNLVSRTDGQVGLHVEHSWGDPTTFLSLFDHVVAAEKNAYEEDGHPKRIKDDTNVLTPKHKEALTPRRLRFRIHKSLAKVIREAHTSFLTDVTSQLEIVVEKYDRYGAALPKRHGCEPNSWFQMAVQLAHYLDQDHRASQVYQSISHHIYCRGRTEALRSVTGCSHEMVRAIAGCNEKGEALEATLTEEQQRAHVLAACEEHSRLVKEAEAGQGVGSHLFALFMVSTGQLIPSDFLTLVMRKTKFKVNTCGFPQGASSRARLPTVWVRSHLYRWLRGLLHVCGGGSPLHDGDRL